MNVSFAIPDRARSCMIGKLGTGEERGSERGRTEPPHVVVAQGEQVEMVVISLSGQSIIALRVPVFGPPLHPLGLESTR